MQFLMVMGTLLGRFCFFHVVFGKMLKFKPVPHVFLASITGLFLARDHLCSSGLYPNVRFFNMRRYLGKKTQKMDSKIESYKMLQSHSSCAAEMHRHVLCTSERG